MSPTTEPQAASGSSETKSSETNQAEKTNESAVTALVSKGFKQGVALTKIGNSFPQNAARDLYCAYPGYGRMVDSLSQSILETLSKVLKAHNIKGNIQRRLPDEQFDMVQEFQDILHEGLGADLDVKRGFRHKKSVQTPTKVIVEQNFATPTSRTSTAGSWNLSTSTSSRSAIVARLIAAKNIERPQVNFQTPVDNSALTPFVPKLKEKPNSLKPLAILPEYDESGNICSFLHPYEFELMKFEPQKWQLTCKTPKVPQPLSETELVYVDTLPKLQAALAELRKHKEIAIDVEHHSYRTFMGITCLVQMSTREKDYIFDTLALREDMHILNEVLTDPKIVKILHGADLDVEWLQRDLALYIVNMLDTHKAAKALNMARVSLSFLLKHYMNIDADKTFQLADWRMRPLPEELITYARQDTHYLIYIYERMTNELLDLDSSASTLRVAYQHSTDVCKKRYTKPKITDTSYLDLMRKSNRIFDNRQTSALRDLFQWRDTTARLEDESYGYVLPNHMMLQIAESLPREMQGILACCNPIPPPVRQQLHALHQIILRARDQPLVKPILEYHLNRPQRINDKFLNSKIYCPHDLVHLEDLRDDLPTLINLDKTEEPPKENVRPKVYFKQRGILFSNIPTDMDEERRQISKAESKFLRMPFKRYMAMLPLLEEERRAEAERLHNEMKSRQLCPAAPLPIIKPDEDNDLNDSQPVADDNDDLYKISLKEQLKRKHQQAHTKSNDQHSKYAKRFKAENSQQTPNDAKLNFNNSSLSNASNASNVNKSVIEINDSGAEDDAPKEMPIAREQNTSSHRPAKKGNKNNKKFKAKQRLHAQSSSKPITLPKASESGKNFDYKQVDFKKFQGGAQRARGPELKGQFHGKNHSNKAQNKQFNKLFTFSNVKGKK